MSSLKYHRAGFVERPRSAREVALHLVASSLRSASAKLARLSRRLAPPAARVAQGASQLEFYAEAGAPEGALYLDGKFVGWVGGVQRL